MQNITESDKDWAVKADHEEEDLELAGWDPKLSQADWYFQMLG